MSQGATGPRPADNARPRGLRALNRRAAHGRTQGRPRDGFRVRTVVLPVFHERLRRRPRGVTRCGRAVVHPGPDDATWHRPPSPRCTLGAWREAWPAVSAKSRRLQYGTGPTAQAWALFFAKAIACMLISSVVVPLSPGSDGSLITSGMPLGWRRTSHEFSPGSARGVGDKFRHRSPMCLSTRSVRQGSAPLARIRQAHFDQPIRSDA